jgi:hypothetical protein
MGVKTPNGTCCDRRGESMDLPQTKDVQRRLQHRPRGTGAHVMNKHSLAIADPTGWPPHGKPPRSVQPGHKLARSSTRGRTRLAARRGMHSPATPRGLPLRRAHAPCLPDRDELTAHGVDSAAPRSAHHEHRTRARLAGPRVVGMSPGGGSRLRGSSAPLKDLMVTTARRCHAALRAGARDD